MLLARACSLILLGSAGETFERAEAFLLCLGFERQGSNWQEELLL